MNVESFSSAWRGNLSCEECSTRLNVFRKKKICYFCKNSFCQLCITRREDKKFCCQKCQILTARPLDRNKLLNLRSRDLINYLTSRQIPTNGCVEKEDLVNVLIKAVNNSCFHPSSTAFLDSNSSINNYPNSSRNNFNSTAHLSNLENLYNDGIRITGHNSTESEVNGDQPSCFVVRPPINQSPNETEQFSAFPGGESNRLADSADNNQGVSVSGGGSTGDQTASNYNFDLGNNTPDRASLPLNKPLMLSDIKNRSDLDALSIKQLKELLMRNRTDFKGCVERAELIQKVNRLWSDYTISRKDLENLSLEELCKICMDAPIECVLLECGHMATCTSCGKQLCECPICRQYVVRCVRTFKA